nr:trypsin-like serine protease [Actinomadura madurae]
MTVTPRRLLGAALLAAALLLPILAAPSAHAVVGGTPARTAAYPWLAAVGSPIFLVRPSGQFCGGVLTEPDKLLTAGHCVSMFRSVPGVLTATFGRDDLVGAGGETVAVTSVRVHPEYRETSFKDETVGHHDLAVLTLARRVNRPVAALGTPGNARTGRIARLGLHLRERPVQHPSARGPRAAPRRPGVRARLRRRVRPVRHAVRRIGHRRLLPVRQRRPPGRARTRRRAGLLGLRLRRARLPRRLRAARLPCPDRPLPRRARGRMLAPCGCW